MTTFYVHPSYPATTGPIGPIESHHTVPVHHGPPRVAPIHHIQPIRQPIPGLNGSSPFEIPAFHRSPIKVRSRAQALALARADVEAKAAAQAEAQARYMQVRAAENEARRMQQEQATRDAYAFEVAQIRERRRRIAEKHAQMELELLRNRQKMGLNGASGNQIYPHQPIPPMGPTGSYHRMPINSALPPLLQSPTTPLESPLTPSSTTTASFPNNHPQNDGKPVYIRQKSRRSIVSESTLSDFRDLRELVTDDSVEGVSIYVEKKNGRAKLPVNVLDLNENILDANIHDMDDTTHDHHGNQSDSSSSDDDPMGMMDLLGFDLLAQMPPSYCH